MVLGGHAVLVSDGTFSGGNSGPEDSFSLEILLAPVSEQWASSTILSFYSPERLGHFTVLQSGDDLALDLVKQGSMVKSSHRSLYADSLLHQGRVVLVTVVAAKNDVVVYADGVVKRSVKGYGLSRSSCTGILLVGDSPRGNRTWKGEYLGLAFYDRPLSVKEVEQHYEKWNQHQATADSLGAAVLYKFDQTAGDKVRSQGPMGPDLLIPKHYFRSDAAFLEPFWKEFSFSWSYAIDLAVNFFGLFPLGFCFAALFSWRENSRRSLLYTALFGLCVSTFIEVMQGFIPTRFSGTTDILTNTAGTAAGAWLYLNEMTQAALWRLGIIHYKRVDPN